MASTAYINLKFSDLNLLYGQTQDGPIVTEELAVRNSIINILTTSVGSRLFNRSFGCNLLPLLWSFMDDITTSQISEEIKASLERWETRISIVEIVVRPDYINAAYYVKIGYKIPALSGNLYSVEFNMDQNT